MKDKIKLIGLIGHPIKQSYSPFIHNVAAQFKNVDYIYTINFPSSRETPHKILTPSFLAKG